MAKERKFRSLAQFLYSIGENTRFAPDAAFAPPRSENEGEVKEKKSPFLSYRLRIKSSLAKMCEQSFFLTLLSRFYHSFFALRVRSFGVLFFSCGFLQILSYFVGAYIPFLGGDEENLLFGVTLVFLAILCSFTRGDVKDSLKKSFLFRGILSPFFGVRSWQFSTSRGRDRFKEMISLGAILAFFSVVFSPVAVLRFLFLIAFTLFIFYLPEAGLLSLGFSIFLFPFAILSKLCLLTLVSFLCKCAVGKRSLMFSLSQGIVLLAFSPLIFSREEGAFSLFFTVFALYYMISSFLRTLQWIRRFLACIALGGVFAALLLCGRSLLEIFFPSLIRYFPKLLGIFFIPSDTSYGALLVILCPLAVGLIHSFQNKGRYLLYLMAQPILLGAVFAVKNAALWNGLILAFLFYFLFTYRSSFIWIFSSGLVLVTLLQLLPAEVLEKLGSLFGFGTVSGMASAEGFFSQINHYFGVFLIPSAILMMGVFLWQVILFRKEATKPEVFPQVLGASCAAVAFAVLALQHVAADIRCLVLFTVILSIPGAAYRCAKREEQRLPY